MSYYRPDSASLLTITTSKIVSGAGMLIAAAMATGAITATLPAALLLGATSIATWKSANIGGKARDYNIKRQKAFELADKNGTPPKLPVNPFLDPLKQPSTMTTTIARFGSIMMLGVAALSAFSGIGANYIGGEVATKLITSAIFFAVGGTSLRMTNIASKARRYAEQEQVVNQNIAREKSQSPIIEPRDNLISKSQNSLAKSEVIGKHTAALMAERQAMRNEYKGL